MYYLLIGLCLHPGLVVPDVLDSHSKPLVNPGKGLSVTNKQNFSHSLHMI